MFLKAEFRSDFYAWEIARMYLLYAFVFLPLSRIAVCESLSLFSSSNSSYIHSPLQITLLTSTPTLSGVAHGQTPRSPQEQPAGKSSLETTRSSFNAGSLSRFGILAGNEETPIRTTEVISFSSPKMDPQIVDTTQGSPSVGKALQSENRKSTKRSTLKTGMVQTSAVQHITRIAQELLSTSHQSGEIETYFRFSSESSVESDTAISKMKFSIVLSPSTVVSRKSARVTRTTDKASDFSVLSSHETFTGSELNLTSNSHATNYLLSSHNLSPGEARSKSTFLSHYSTGTTTQAPGVSTSVDQLTARVSSTFTSSAIVRASTSSTSSFAVSSTVSQVSSTFTSSAITRASTSSTSSFAVSSIVSQVSSTFSSSTITRASTSFTSSSTISQVSSTFTSPTTYRISPSFTISTITRASASFISSFAVKSSAKSAWSSPHLHLTKASTVRSFAHITSVQSLLSPAVPSQGKDILTCKINNVICVCFNCEEARKNGTICCMDLGDNKNIQQGVTMSLLNITVQRFHHQVKAVTRIIAEVVWDSCRVNASLCVAGEKMSDAASERKPRSLEGQIVKNKRSSDRIRTKRGALRPDINPSLTNISGVDAIIYSISSKAGQSSSVQTAFYVVVTSLKNGTNQTVVLDGKGLLHILRNKRRTLENRLNLTIASFTASHQSSELATTSSHQASLVPNSSQGSHSTRTTLRTREGRHL